MDIISEQGKKITLMSIGASLVAAGILILTQAPKEVNITGMFMVVAGLVVMVIHEKVGKL